ncbi:MAG: hypothetical protein RL291_542 [Pseudomonadota bacterium]|jgi:pyridoxine/pyridoxamine 5'-phosphate oxidase
MANLQAVPESASKEPADITQQAWSTLERGARDRRAGLHTLTLSTTGLDGYPEARTVVLRYADRSAREIRFHTDVRSTKFREMTVEPKVALLGYDASSKLQLRLKGFVRLHTKNDVALAAWKASQPQSLMCYRQPEAPSLAVASALPAPDMRGLSFKPEDGFENFAVVGVTIRSLEWLYLSRLGHQRIRFSYDQSGVEGEPQWLAP